MLLLRIYLKFTKIIEVVAFPPLISQNSLGMCRAPWKRFLLEDFLIYLPHISKGKQKSEGKTINDVQPIFINTYLS